MRRDESLAMTAMAREAIALREQLDAWKGWAERVLGECGMREAHRLGNQTMRTLLGRLAKSGAATEVKP